ncbi:MAG: restriction endonuclease subunit S [Kiritimatiellae bacterium]|nr:restriction endonuclease subunit S [Kiritimatiellia bacterium]
MKGEWVERKIGTLGRVVTGKTPSTTDPNNFGGPYPFITIPDLDGRVFITTTERTLSEKGARTLRSSLLPPGSVMMSCIATVGRCGITVAPSFTNQQINSVIPNEEVDSRLLYYVFTQLGHALQAAGGGGSVYTNVSKSRFSDIVVRFPRKIEEQRAIAHILGVLDDKIEVNRRMSQTLEAMARALFKSWFVAFEPVRAKMEARWKRGQSLPGLPAELYDLFPARLVDSPLGPIPQGWGVGRLGEIAENPRRGVQPEEIPQGTPYIALEHMPRRSIALSGWGIGDELESSKFEFKAGEILFGKLRPYFHKVGVAPVDGVCSTDIVVVKPRRQTWFGFVLGHVSSTEFVEYANARATGTKMPRTSWTDMARYELALPPDSVVEVFGKTTCPWLERIIRGIHEARTLAALRDALLPKLISGEIRVKDAERFLEGIGI